jgi:hypothetical protein
MWELVCVVAIVGIVSAAIVAIVFGRGFRGKAGPGGAEVAVTREEGNRSAAPARRSKKNGRCKNP